MIDYNGLLEISEIFIVNDVFFDFKFHQIRFLPGPRSLYNAPQTPSWLGRGHPSHLSLFGVELSSGAPALWSA